MLWIIGGTSNATEICRKLVSAKYPVIITVTTDYGYQLSSIAGAVVMKGMLNEREMAELIISMKIQMVVDASHPFAAEASLNAINAAQQAGIPYLRFERLNPEYDDAVYVSDYAEAINKLSDTHGNILLTTGSKYIERFIPLGSHRLYARVLSSSHSIVLCEKAGLKPDHIIGITGVCSKELNLVLLREYDIQYLVTKESGPEGGLSEKIEAAREAGVTVFIIKRPVVDYPEIYSDYKSLYSRIIEIYNNEALQN